MTYDYRLLIGKHVIRSSGLTLHEANDSLESYNGKAYRLCAAVMANKRP